MEARNPPAISLVDCPHKQRHRRTRPDAQSCPESDSNCRERTPGFSVMIRKPLKCTGLLLASYVHLSPTGEHAMSRLVADLRYTLRQLRRGPGFAATDI